MNADLLDYDQADLAERTLEECTKGATGDLLDAVPPFSTFILHFLIMTVNP